MRPVGLGSGATSSQSRPAGGNEVSRQRSAGNQGVRSASVTACQQCNRPGGQEDVPSDASVWPIRASVPPSTARRGTMCPGRLKSCAVDAGSASLRAVSARSCAEIPVVVPRSNTGREEASSRRGRSASPQLQPRPSAGRQLSCLPSLRVSPRPLSLTSLVRHSAPEPSKAALLPDLPPPPRTAEVKTHHAGSRPSPCMPSDWSPHFARPSSGFRAWRASPQEGRCRCSRCTTSQTTKADRSGQP
jgi:hypothetical protein